MKTIRLKTLLLLLMLALPMALAAQGAYKGQLQVSEEQFSLQGELLHVYMKVSYDDDVINTGETLTFTPTLKSNERYARLTSVAINGDARERYERRADKLKNRRRINVPVVTRDKKDRTRYFIYDTTVPFQQWMTNAALYVECEESSWQGRDPHTYEDMILQRLTLAQPVGVQTALQEPVTESYAPAVAISKNWVQFLSPESASSVGRVITGSIRLPYGVKLKRRDYRRMADTLKLVANRETKMYGSHLLGVEITGYGAPIGNRAKNEERAALQTLKLRRLLAERQVPGKNELRVQWIAEDWDSIRQLVAATPIALQAAVSDIIASIAVDQGREDALRRLGAGGTYDVIKRDIFPRVCRMSYKLTFSARPVNITMSSYRNGAIPAGITPDNFYQTANAFELGSQEFCDVIDLAARLFPQCAEAAIDAAGVALLKGDLQRARQYLTPWETDHRAWCNLGLLYLAEGNRDKAEVYLRMAEADGVASAREALQSIRAN